MSPHRARLLLAGTIALASGWGLCWLHLHYGWTPVLLFAFLTGIGWLFGYIHCFGVMSAETAQAHRERDDACAIAAAVREGQRFGVIPIRVDIPRVPRQGAS